MIGTAVEKMEQVMPDWMEEHIAPEAALWGVTMLTLMVVTRLVLGKKFS